MADLTRAQELTRALADARHGLVVAGPPGCGKRTLCLDLPGVARSHSEGASVVPQAQSLFCFVHRNPAGVKGWSGDEQGGAWEPITEVWKSWLLAGVNVAEENLRNVFAWGQVQGAVAAAGKRIVVILDDYNDWRQEWGAGGFNEARKAVEAGLQLLVCAERLPRSARNSRSGDRMASDGAEGTFLELLTPFPMRLPDPEEADRILREGTGHPEAIARELLGTEEDRRRIVKECGRYPSLLIAAARAASSSMAGREGRRLVVGSDKQVVWAQRFAGIEASEPFRQKLGEIWDTLTEGERKAVSFVALAEASKQPLGDLLLEARPQYSGLAEEVEDHLKSLDKDHLLWDYGGRNIASGALKRFVLKQELAQTYRRILSLPDTQKLKFDQVTFLKSVVVSGLFYIAGFMCRFNGWQPWVWGFLVGLGAAIPFIYIGSVLLRGRSGQ